MREAFHRGEGLRTPPLWIALVALLALLLSLFAVAVALTNQSYQRFLEDEIRATTRMCVESAESGSSGSESR